MPEGKKTVPMEDSDVQEGDPVQVLREPLPPKCATTNTDTVVFSQFEDNPNIRTG